jgi:predicted transcriptional regulator
MNSFYERQHIKFRYGPLAQKTLHNVLKRELVEQFGFENMGLIADGLIQRFLEILADFDPQQRTLLPGQALWLAVSRRDRARLDQPMWRCKLLPVRLTLLDPEDLVQASQGTAWEDLRERRVVRLLKQAYDQGGVLGQHDVGVLLGLSQATVSRLIRGYQQRTGEVLPFRGTVHDLGRTLTHKRQAVEGRLQGLLTQEIARRIHHTPEAVDAYLTDFERVYQLHRDGKTLAQIAFLTRIAQSVVREYLDLIDQYEITEARCGQLRNPHAPPSNGQPARAKPGRRHGPTRRRKVQ